jgi:hypothetical protein
MRKDIHRLAEAVRALQIEPTGQSAPNCIRLAIVKEKLPEALLEAREALDAFDAAGGVTAAPPPTEDVAKLRQAIDGLLRYVKMRGLETDDAEDIVQSALGKSKKRRKRLEPLPVFAPNGWKHRKKFKPTLRIALDNKSDMESDARKMRWVIDELGAAAAAPPDPASRPATPATAG